MNNVMVYRGGYKESTHIVHVAVVNQYGELIASYGDPTRLTFARSTMKPFQALPIITTGAAKHFSFTKRDLAISCASHSGEAFHREQVLDILKRLKQPEAVLQCGTHVPRDMESYKALIRSGQELSPVFSNCSGKHAGMVATAVHMGETLVDYYKVEHPVQQRIIEAIAEVCAFPAEQIELGVDGCGLPVHRIPLINLGIGFARLAHPDSKVHTYAKELNQMKAAMLTHPELVAGTNRFDSDLMRVYGDRIVAKVGAEGVQAIGIIDKGLGIALKVEDGNERATYVAAMEVLRQLEIGEQSEFDQLKDYVTPVLKNKRDEAIGKIEADFLLSHVKR